MAAEGPGITLEPVRVGRDAEFEARLRDYWRDLGAGPAPTWHEPYVARLCAEEGRSRHTLWALEGGRRVGFVMFRLDEDWMFPQRRIGYIAEFTVFAPWRRRGVGRRLFASAQAWLAERGCAQIELDVLPDNGPALAFWGSLGFSLAYHHMRRA